MAWVHQHEEVGWLVLVSGAYAFGLMWWHTAAYKWRAGANMLLGCQGLCVWDGQSMSWEAGSDDGSGECRSWAK